MHLAEKFHNFSCWVTFCDKTNNWLWFTFHNCTECQLLEISYLQIIVFAQHDIFRKSFKSSQIKLEVVFLLKQFHLFWFFILDVLRNIEIFMQPKGESICSNANLDKMHSECNIKQTFLIFRMHWIYTFVENIQFLLFLEKCCLFSTPPWIDSVGSLYAIKLLYEGHKSFQNGYSNTSNLYGQYKLFYKSVCLSKFFSCHLQNSTNINVHDFMFLLKNHSFPLCFSVGQNNNNTEWRYKSFV